MQSLINTALATIGFGLIVSSTTWAADTDPKTTVESLNTSWNQALNSGDAKALANLYAENAILSPGNGQVLTGRAEIEKLFQSFVDAGVHNHTLEIVTVGGNDKMLYQVAKWNANSAEKDGRKPSFGGITTSIFERDSNGRWVARSHVWNAGN
jgi:uncharacterized protein (TIGR02246 family)